MIRVDKNKFSCNCCFSEDNVKSISFINKFENRIDVFLCEKCRKDLYEILRVEFNDR